MHGNILFGMAIFKTFKPAEPIVAKYVDYYYLDLKPENIVTEFECFPHHNNTISLYSSHRRLPTSGIIYDEKAKACQIFTPVRDKVLFVRQTGKVHRVVIVFKLLGIQQFFPKTSFSNYILDYPFFSPTELRPLFDSTDENILQKLCQIRKFFIIFFLICKL